jgi:hypothetical protein
MDPVQCFACYNPEGPFFPINDVHACPTCLNTLIRPVANGSLMYPVMINNQPADLSDQWHKDYLDRDLLDKYTAMGPQHTVPPHLRVHCVNQHYVGEKLTTTAANGTYLAAISQCDTCQHATCMICKKGLDKDAPLATIVDHGCKKKIAADQKIREESFAGLERGKDYQFCPNCKRDIQLSAACYHIVCPCFTQFCYLCGVAAVRADGHWDGGSCPLYPVNLDALVPQVPAVGGAPDLELDEDDDDEDDDDDIGPEDDAPPPARFIGQRPITAFEEHRARRIVEGIYAYWDTIAQEAEHDLPLFRPHDWQAAAAENPWGREARYRRQLNERLRYIWTLGGYEQPLVYVPAPQEEQLDWENYRILLSESRTVLQGIELQNDIYAEVELRAWDILDRQREEDEFMHEG